MSKLELPKDVIKLRKKTSKKINSILRDYNEGKISFDNYLKAVKEEQNNYKEEVLTYLGLKK